MRSSKSTLARDLYVKGIELEAIANTLQVTKRTIQNYKAKDKANGCEWDELRAKTLLSKGGDKLYSSFLEAMNSFLTEIKDSDMKPEIKAEKISQIGDAFSKMKKVAAFEDPEVFKHGIMKKTLKTLIMSAKENFSKECLEELINLIDQIQEELTDVSF